MKWEQSKSLPWGRVWIYAILILIIVKFGELLLWISLRIINALRSYIKHSKVSFIRYPNTSKLVLKTRLRLFYSTNFSVFRYLTKHSSLCLIYYFTVWWSGFQMTVEKPKPKQLFRPITTGTNSTMNQSQFLVIICSNSLKARGKSRVHGAINTWFWFYFSLVEKLARVFLANH